MACPVCFGGEDTIVRESLNAGIGVLLGVTGVVLGLFGHFFVTLARRASANAHLMDPRAPHGGDSAGRREPRLSERTTP